MSTQAVPFNAATAIAYTRQKQGLSARGLSAKADLGEVYVSRVEAGKLEPSLKCFARIVTALGWSDREIALIVRQEAAQPRSNGNGG